MSRAAIRAAVSLREALIDPNLLGNVLVGESWTTWRALLLACMGERLTADELSIFQRVTGDRTQAPPSRIEEAAFIIGRRGGKDRKRGRFIAQSIARFERIGKMKFDTIIRAKARGDAALGK